MRNTLKFLISTICCTVIFGNYGYSVEDNIFETPNYIQNNEANINMSIEELSEYVSNNVGNIKITNDDQLENFSTVISLAGIDHRHFFDENYLPGCTPINEIIKKKYSKDDIKNLSNSLLNEVILFHNEYDSSDIINRKVSDLIHNAWEKLIYYTLVNNMNEEYNKLCNLAKKFLPKLDIKIDIESIKMQDNYNLNSRNGNNFNNNMRNNYNNFNNNFYNNMGYLNNNMEYLNDNQQNNINRYNQLNINTNFQILRNSAYESRNNNTLDRNKRINKEEAYKKYPILTRINKLSQELYVRNNSYYLKHDYFSRDDINALLQQNISFFNEYSTTVNSEVLTLFENAWDTILRTVPNMLFCYDNAEELQDTLFNLAQKFLPQINIKSFKNVEASDFQ